jgi:hypothetical protein
MLDKSKLKEKIESLKGLEKRYYEFLPDICWMSEETQAKQLGIGRSRLKTVKSRLVKEELLQLQFVPNGKRKNLKHVLRKTYPIRLRESAGEDFLGDNYRYELIEEYNYYIPEIYWFLLQKYTEKEINNMGKLELVQLYMDCGFIVLPTHYPIFVEDGVSCSCPKGLNCSNKGKHPVFRYGYIDALNYETLKKSYIKKFAENPKLNIGFKVMGYSVLDVDYKHNGDKTLRELQYEYEVDMNNVLSVQSGNGRHIYTNNIDLKNTAGVIGAGLDIRSDGGFIVAPGSQHKSGKFYQWNEIGEVATIPEDWIESGLEENSVKDRNSLKNNPIAVKKLVDIVLPRTLTSDYVIKEGGRELTLFKFGCRERGKGADTQKIYNVLISIRDKHCECGDEPITDDDVREIANCVSTYPTNREKNSNS